MKRMLLVIGGLVWYLFALGFVLVLGDYLARGTGLQFFGWILSSESVLFGMVHVIGLVMAALICLAIGTGLSVCGMVRPDDRETTPQPDRRRFLSLVSPRQVFPVEALGGFAHVNEP